MWLMKQQPGANHASTKRSRRTAKATQRVCRDAQEKLLIEEKIMIENFNLMPKYLKILTLLGFAVLVMVAATLLPNGVDVYGKHVSTAEWWSSGMGFLFLFDGMILSTSALLMLKRSNVGRAAYVLGCVALNASGVFAIYVATGDSDITVHTLKFSIVFTVLVTLFLYGKKAVRDYFASTNK